VIVEVAEDESVKNARDDLCTTEDDSPGIGYRLSRHIRYDQIVDVTAPFDDALD
jgi:hypothetical protein